MIDIVDKQTRSRMMSGIKGQNTKPEMKLRQALHSRGLRFRLHGKKLPGKPDLVFPKFHAVVFVHGCFWHRHEGCRYATMPATRIEFWETKFRENVARDYKNLIALQELGWRVGIVWECEIQSKERRVAEEIVDWLGSCDGTFGID